MNKLLLISVLTCSIFQSYSQTGSITGTVRTSDHKPAQSVFVVVKDTDISGVTDRDGMFSFSNVPAGDQTLVFNSMGLNPIEKHVEVRRDETTTVELTLEESITELRAVEIIVYRNRCFRGGSRTPEPDHHESAGHPHAKGSKYFSQ